MHHGTREIRVFPGALLERTQRSLISANTTTLTVSAYPALLPTTFKIAGNADCFMGDWLSRYSDHRCTLIERLGPDPLRKKVVNPLWN